MSAPPMAAPRVRAPMRALPAVAVLLLALPLLPSVPADSAPGPLRISEVLPVPDAAQGQREFIEVWNPGNASVDLAGWSVRDMATASGAFNEFTFTTGTLAPGSRIVVWSNGSADARGPAWSTSPSKTVWNDAGDAATLLDPAGEVADWLAYGNAAQVPPIGFESLAKPPAPARGSSVAIDGDAWQAGTPSPALAPGAVGGLASLSVANVAPQAQLSGIPATVKPGQAIDVGLAVTDANGAADIASWTLAINGAVVAQGSGMPVSTHRAVAPAATGPWSFTLAATDAGGLAAQASAVANVRDPRLALDVPGGLLRFPELVPGQGAVQSLDFATLRNEGTDAVTPLLDVSPFSGPATIPVDGRLSVGIARPDGNVTWIPYAGPLTALPAIAPGAALSMTLRLDEVPAPLAAGLYGTTFAVVTA